MGIMKSLVGNMSVSLTVLSTFVFADSVVREPWRTAGNAVTRTGGLWGTGDALDVETTTIQHDSHNRSDTLGRLQCMYVAWQGQQVHSPILTAQRATQSRSRSRPQQHSLTSASQVCLHQVGRGPNDPRERLLNHQPHRGRHTPSHVDSHPLEGAID